MHINGKLNQMSLALVGMLMLFSVAAAADFTWTLGADVPVPEFNCLDIDPAVVRDGAQLQVLYGAGGAEQLRIRRFEGSDLDDLHALPDGTRRIVHEAVRGRQLLGFGGLG
jgi:hypothetical protein